MTKPLDSDERAELELLRDLRDRVIGFGGDDYAVTPWVMAHRYHADKPYIGCPFCRDKFIAVAKVDQLLNIIKTYMQAQRDAL